MTLSTVLAVFSIGMTYLGVHVTIHPPTQKESIRRSKLTFFVMGICALCLVIGQGARTSLTQMHALSQIETLTDDVKSTHKLLTVESTKREQAEKDLAIIVENSGRSTRAGVAADLRSAPVKVSLEKTAREHAEPIRAILDAVLYSNDDARRVCLAGDASCYENAKEWYYNAVSNIKVMEDETYSQRFALAGGVHASFREESMSTDDTLKILAAKAEAVIDFIREWR